MVINYEGFYAVIVVCLVVLTLVVCCCGFLIIRRNTIARNAAANAERSAEEWQAMGTVPVFAGPIDEEERNELERVRAWQMKYPPKGSDWIDVEAQPLVRERGVAAWMFLENEHMDEEEDESNAAVMDKTTIVFCHGQGCVLTNLPLPTKEFVYWEVKVLQLHEQDRLAIGLATKPYPGWRLPGWHRHSVAYHSHTGAVHASDPLVGRPYGPPFKEGDVIGVGYLSSSGTVFFTRNGKNLGKASIGFRFPVYPVVGSNGPCQASVNFGQQDFLFAAANAREAALAPKQGTLPPPPAYGDVRNTIMLFGASETDTNNQQHLEYLHTTPLSSSQPTDTNPPPPQYT
ncbi:hypothetical protein VTP01DRAFT_9949 [Rhizomucor pusillus]|uniref:uncharacterized protein n=1 Tax=Rhizomucor pusillus TaxID=4840 RepID=UPI003742788B